MHTTYLRYLLLGAGLAYASKEQKPTVYENVGAERYEELLKSNHAILTSCDAPEQSKHSLLPELHRVANGIAAIDALSDRPVAVATVDCDEESSRALCGGYDIHTYPAIRLVYGKQASRTGSSRFRGMRKGYALTSFVSRNVLDRINRPQTQEALNELLVADSSVLILQTSSSSDADLVESIADQAKGKITFGAVDSPELLVAQKASPSLLCYRNGEDYTYQVPFHLTEPDRALTGDDVRNKDNVRLFLEHCAAPRVHPFSRRGMNKLYSLRKPIVYIFTDLPLSIATFLNPLQKAWAEVVPFVHVDVNEHPHLATNLGLKLEDPYPAVTVEGVINDQVYPMPASWEVNPHNVEAFVGGILHGKATGGRDGMDWVQKAGLKPNLKPMKKDEL